jgi:hypothetical protein
MYLCFTCTIWKMLVILSVVMRKDPNTTPSSFILLILVFTFPRTSFSSGKATHQCITQPPHINASSANKCKDKKYPACAGRLNFLLFCFLPLPLYLSFVLSFFSFFLLSFFSDRVRVKSGLHFTWLCENWPVC